MSFTNVQGGEWDDEPPVVDDHLFSKQKGVQGEYYYYKMKDATQDWNTEMIQFENVEITLTQDALMCAFSMSGTQNVTRIDVEVSLGGFYHKWSASPDNTKKNQDDKTFLLKKDQKNKDGFWDNIEDIQGEKLTVTFTCVTKNAGIERKDRYVQVP